MEEQEKQGSDDEVDGGDHGDEKDEDDGDDDDDEEETGQSLPPPSIRVTTQKGKRVVSDHSSVSGDSNGDISEMILNGHNIGKNTKDALLEKEIGKWVRKQGFKCQKFIVTSKYRAESPLLFHCMKACLGKDFDNSTWIVSREKYFLKYGKYIKRTLNHKRNCCQSSVKATVRGKKGLLELFAKKSRC